MRNFGEVRVIEPKGSLPVTAWKVDNSRELKGREIRILLDYITMERDSMCQICSICEHDTAKIADKIMKFVNERGKIHNPYTNSGAVCSGVVEEISDDCGRNDVKVGDHVVCMSTMTGIPVYIEEIEDIDYDFGQIKCKGYAILFETTILEICDDLPENRKRYLRRAIDEEGTFFGLSEIVKDMDIKKVLIISVSLVEIALLHSR